MWGVDDFVGGRYDAGGRLLNGVRTDEVYTAPHVRLPQRSSFLNWPLHNGTETRL